MKPALRPPLWLLLPWLLFAPHFTLGKSGTDKSFQEGEKLFTQKIYHKAIQKFQTFLEHSPKGEKADQARLYIFRCLFRLKRYDQAEKTALQQVKQMGKNIYQVKLWRELTKMMLQKPHWGYRRGKTIYWGRYVPNAVYVNSRTKDMQKAITYGEKGRALCLILYERTPTKEVQREWYKTNRALLSVFLTQFFSSPYRFQKIPASLEKSLPKEYAPSLTLLEKTLYLFHETASLGEKIQSQELPRLLLLHSEFLCTLLRLNQKDYLSDKHPPLLNPWPLWKKLWEKFPGSDEGAKALLLIGRTLENRRKYKEAEQYYEKVLRQYPQSSWRENAQYYLAEMRRERLQIQQVRIALPKEQPEIQLRLRNISSLKVTVRPFQLQEFLQARERQKKIPFPLGSSLFKEFAPFTDSPILSMEVPTADKKDYQPFEMTLTLPLQKIGAYLVELKSKKITAYQLVVVTDLCLMIKQGKQKALLFLTNALTGKPVPGATLYFTQKGYKFQLTQKKVTNDQGVALVNLTSRYSHIYVALAKGNRYALLGPRYVYSYYWHRADQGIYLYAITDRPVYRPGHKVHFKIYLRRRTAKGYQTLANEEIRLTVRHQGGQKVYEKIFRTDENGSAFDQFTLPKQAKLGLYYIQCSLLKRRAWTRSYGAYFRVEEYKKPPFEVICSLPPKAVKLGKKITVKIQGKYYFGSPVVGAKVQYEVYKEPFYPIYYPSSEWDWLYGYGYGYRRYYDYREYYRQFVTSGIGKTNEKGEFTFQIDTANWGEQPVRLFVSARLQDQSRRTVKGSATGVVSPKAFYAYLYPERGFYTKGDKARFTLTTLSPTKRPLSVEGTLRFYRISGNDKKELLKELKVKTNTQGKAQIEFESPVAGKIEALFEAKDTWGEVVKASTEVWFASEDFTGERLQIGKLEVFADKREYKVGEKAKLLIQSPMPNVSLLLVEEVGNKLYRYQVTSLQGKFAFVELPIEKAHSPLFRLSLTGGFGGKIHTQAIDIPVPPRSNLLDLRITSVKKAYSPGKKATLILEVRDKEGRPLSLPVCLSVFDRSITYIQPSFTPSIYKTFYGKVRRNRLSLHHSYTYRPPSHILDTQPRLPYPKRRISLSLFRFASSFAVQKALARQRGPAGIGAPERKGAPEAFERRSMARKKGTSSRIKDRAVKLPRIRKNFADTAYWNPYVVTDEQGKAKVEFTLPDSLTSWQVRAWAISNTTQVGEGKAIFVTRKKLMIRPELPRFSVERDKLYLSALVHNELETKKNIRCRIEVEPASLVKWESPREKTLLLESHKVGRVDWVVRIQRSGILKVRMFALTEEESDAAEVALPLLPHGVEKSYLLAGSVPGKKATLSITVPKEVQPFGTKLTVTLTPSLITAMLDALPYLIQYPYGCTEQTMSRFLPTVLTANVLKHLGISLEALAERRGTYLKIQKTPIYSTEKMHALVHKGLARLYAFQHSDGGWGWWKTDRTNPYMTAYVTYGLFTAKKAGYPVLDSVLHRALGYLQKALPKVSSLHTRVYMLFSLAYAGKAPKEELKKIYPKQVDQLTLYTKALLALALYRSGMQKEASLLLEHLLGFVKENPKQGTAYFPAPSSYWYWYNNQIETNAWILSAFVHIRPRHPLLPKLVQWLLKQRRGVRWSSTKSTAFVIYALSDYVKQRGELRPEYTLTVKVNGKVKKQVTVTQKNLFFFDNQLVLKGMAIPPGEHRIEIEKDGAGALYYTLELRYYTKEESLTSSSSGIQIERRYYRILRKTLREKGKLKRVEERIPLKGALSPGSIVEVELILKTDKPYEYLLIEDPRAAGFEPEVVRSGYEYQNGLGMQREVRDTKVAFFLSWLPKGTHRITYRLRAETPGEFHVMPAYVEAMYAPRIRATSAEAHFTVQDK